jgi:hypothetical protein
VTGPIEKNETPVMKLQNIDPNYKFNEQEYFKEVIEYVNTTYHEHYASGGKRQSIENTIDRGNGLPFCIENIHKYLDRFGEKEGYNRKDILKMIHYCLFILYIVDNEKT